MSTILVTCMYNGLDGSLYGGRNREHMYKGSLCSIAKSGLPIICFTFQHHLRELQQYFNERGHTNVTMVARDILAEDFSADVLKIKHTNPELYFKNDLFWQARCPEIMWTKTRMLSQVIRERPEVSKVYWIDAGLSSATLLRYKYFPNIADGDYYTSDGLFDSHFFLNLDAYTSKGLFAALHTRPNNHRIPEHYNTMPYSVPAYAMIGGLFGGNSADMMRFAELFEPYIHKMITNGELHSEEAVYTGIVNDNRELFAPIFFDTFYSEDWPNAYNPNHTSFIEILEHFTEAT